MEHFRARSTSPLCIERWEVSTLGGAEMQVCRTSTMFTYVQLVGEETRVVNRVDGRLIKIQCASEP